MSESSLQLIYHELRISLPPEEGAIVVYAPWNIVGLDVEVRYAGYEESRKFNAFANIVQL